MDMLQFGQNIEKGGKNMKYRLGLDIGIASVGWCILDEDDSIVKAGVRLFPEGKSDENQKRRARRASRRLLRRRQFRVERIRELLYRYGIIDNYDYDFYTNETTPYHVRKKGLYEKLSKKELAIAMFHLAKRRGAGEFSIEIKEGNKDEESTKSILAENEKLLREGKYICEIQLERFEDKTQEVRGNRNNFKTSDYIKEAKKIMETQREFYPNLDKNFEEEYVGIVEGRRKYFEGPGKNSPYSWKNQEEWMEGLMGNCTYFPEELRLVKNSYTAEKFNLLNDFNNLKIKRAENNKVTKEEKLELLKLFKGAKKEKNITLKKIASILNVNEEDISGYRIKKDGSPKFAFLKSYVEINNIFKCDDSEILDSISKIATYYQDIETKIEKYREELKGVPEVTEEIIESLAQKLKFTGSHALSKKAIKLIEEELLETSKNQMELFTEKGLVPYKMDFKDEKIKYIPKDYVNNWVLSPTVKRSMFQTINVVNEILKEYGTPEEIVIELAREKNSDDKSKKLMDIQKRNEKENREIVDLLENKKLDKRYFELLKYWKRQDGVCMYSGEIIGIDEILQNPLAFEIDHIIPRSISFDDSQDNKVLVRRIENQKKGQRSPFEYFSSKITERSYDEFKSQVLDMFKNKKISLKKRDLLLLEEDISKYSRNFIARNLVDTRYATREFMSLLRVFFRDKDKKVKIKSIRGSFTSQIRKEWKMTKIREFSHNHHAQDAYIILMAEKTLHKLKWIKDFDEYDELVRTYVKKEEILNDEDFKKLFDYKYSTPIKEYKDYSYSHFVDKKPNRKLTDETLYSTRIFEEKDKKGKSVESEYIVGKILNIYDKKSNVAKYFSDEKKYNELLIYHHDRQTFDKMLKIFNEYGGKGAKVNPFTKYFEEFGKIRKYSKKDNGPEINDLKYRVSQLGNHLDITHKYKDSKNRVIMLKVPTYRVDMYFNGKEYKFISVRYLMLRDRGKYFTIDTTKYEREKTRKGIDEKYNFVFSLYTGDILEVEKQDRSLEKVKFKGVKDDEKKILEVDCIDRNHSKYIEKLKEIIEKKKKSEKKEIKYNFEDELSLILQTTFTKDEGEKFLNSVSLNDRKTVLITKGIKKLKKIYTNVLGKEYNGREKFEEIIKK